MSEQHLPEILASYIEETLELCLSYKMPDIDSDPVSVAAITLADVRQRLDRVDTLLSNTIRLRARAYRMLATVKAEAEDAWDAAAMKRRAAPVQRGDEFYSAREREAEANLATLDKRIGVRKATEVAHLCDEAHDVIRIHHRGLDRVRADVLALLRAAQFESHLER